VGLLAAAATATVGLVGRDAAPAAGVPGPPTSAAVTPAGSGDDAVAPFLAAWERAASGTFVVRSTFERRLAGGQAMSAESVLAQRPPDRLLRQGGTVTGRLAGRQVACAEVEGDPVPCADAGPAPPWPDQVAAEVAAVRRLVTGVSPRYAVESVADGCFRLRLRVWQPAPPYGTRSTFCFDPATGAPTRTEVARPEATDVTTATDISAPTSEDFLVPG
jgi:hypothetical protein